MYLLIETKTNKKEVKKVTCRFCIKIFSILYLMKIVFCFNCAAKSEDKFVLVWLKCCPRYWSRKKGIEGKFFEAEAVGRGWEMFPRFPFFYWGNLDNTEIRLGPNLFERRGKHNYWNRILFSFVWLFRDS